MYNINDAKFSVDGVEIQPVVIPDRRQTTPRLTIAQSIRRSSDPYHAAIAAFSRRDIPHGSKHHTYYFEDESFLTFEVSYMPVEDGCRACS